MKRALVRRGRRFFRPQVLLLESRLQPGTLLFGGLAEPFTDPVATDPLTRDLALTAQRPAFSAIKVPGEFGLVIVGAQRVEAAVSNPVSTPVARQESSSFVPDAFPTQSVVQTASPVQAVVVSQLAAAATAVPLASAPKLAVPPPGVQGSGTSDPLNLQSEALTATTQVDAPTVTDASGMIRNVTDQLSVTVIPGEQGPGDAGDPSIQAGGVVWSSYDSLNQENPLNDGLCGVDYAQQSLFVSGWAELNAGDVDMMVRRKSQDGSTKVWTTLLAGPGMMHDYGQGIKVSGNDVFAVGVIDDPQAPPHKSPYLGPLTTNGVLVKLDAANGALLGAVGFAGAELNGVAIDPNGDVWVSGSGQGEITRDLLIAKFDPMLNLLIAFTYHFTVDGVDAESDAYKCCSIDVDREFNAFVSGFIYDGVNQRPLIVSVDGTGAPRWAAAFATAGLGSWGTGVKVHAPSGEVHLSGALANASAGLKMQDALLAKFSNVGALIYGFRWFFQVDGVRGDLKYNCIDVNGVNEAYVTGAIWNPNNPVEDQDALAFHFSPAGNVIVGSQFMADEQFPATNTDKGCGIVLENRASGNTDLFHVGVTLSDNFLVRGQVKQPVYAGGGDGWKARVRI